MSAQISPGKLSRAHQELEGALRCTKCHAGGNDRLPANCLACHRDIAWLIERRQGFHAAEGRTKCASCHPDHAGEGFALITFPGGERAFDHQRAGWPLTGAHDTVACNSCHTAKFRQGEAATRSVRTTGAGWIGLTTACASCHEDPHRGGLGRSCDKCHATARWNSTPGFTHARTRYVLTGRHATVACAACHLADRLDLRRDAAGRRIPLFRPLPFGQCSACHTDPHVGRLGAQCDKCHVTTAFSEVAAGGFAHERTRFPLRGAHRTTKCDRCHDFSARAGARRNPPAYARCGDCHRDPHGGAATLVGRVVDCAACHDEARFSPSTFTTAQHATTQYALAGSHLRVRCAACHTTVNKVVQMRPAFGRCRDCHGVDPHRGPPDQDCAGCHSVRGFRPSTVDVAAHAKFAFVLEGAHRAVACGNCHENLRPGAARVAGASIDLHHARECVNCHDGPHGEQFARRSNAGRCDGCHDTRQWKPAPRFAHDRDTPFPLAGAHARVACDRCHRPARAGTPVVYKSVASRCESCHTRGP